MGMRWIVFWALVAPLFIAVAFIVDELAERKNERRTGPNRV